MASSEPRGRGDRGSVSAEAAMVLPLMALVTGGLVWMLMVAAAQIQCEDAARTGARAAARAEPASATLAAARSVAPRGARIGVSRDGDLVRVRVEAPTSGPGALSVRLHAHAAALAEDTVGAPP
ncbi:TadE family type IV pilus minor pilin [Streptomyces sp. URMC 123]|uniref:TadE family type IV pilus minor pilin n=1 Tax=Streptomyces sp. URMC 123 TaxID=3423403 RepID=UPI003F1ABDE2